MATVRYFWHGFIHRGKTFIYRYLQYRRPLPLFITFCQMFGRRLTPSARPSLLTFGIDHPIVRIRSSLSYCTGSLAVVLSLWRRDRNRMDSYRVSMEDIPESSIASGARGPWEQRRDSLHCHEEWWGSVPPGVVVFSWVPKRCVKNTLDNGFRPTNLCYKSNANVTKPYELHTKRCRCFLDTLYNSLYSQCVNNLVFQVAFVSSLFIIVER